MNTQTTAKSQISETIGLLTAISIVSDRIAKNLQVLETQSKAKGRGADARRD